MTLYTFDNDDQDGSNCTEGCLENWPPLTVASPDELTLGEGLDAAAFATITRDDGVLQVVRYGVPLYYFSRDNAPGDTNGDGVGEYMARCSRHHRARQRLSRGRLPCRSRRDDPVHLR